MRTAVVLLVVLAAASAAAQEKPAVQPAPQVQGAAAAPAFVYNPEGRRDPFVSLLKRATEARARQGKQPAAGGISGFLVSETHAQRHHAEPRRQRGAGGGARREDVLHPGE